MLIKAPDQAYWVELEEEDLRPEILLHIPDHQRLLYWRGEAESYDQLQQKYQELLATPAAGYLMEFIPRSQREVIWPLQLQKEVGKRRLTAYATGPLGRWTRILGAFTGAQLAIASLESSPENAPTIQEWTIDYGLPKIYPVSRLYGIIGRPLTGSLSPCLHNMAYRLLRLPWLYLPFYVESFGEFLEMSATDEYLRNLRIEGLTSVSPLKEEAWETVGTTRNPFVEIAGACNLVLRDGEHWRADTTDGMGVEEILRGLAFDPQGKKVALLGCGGAGRTIAAKLMARGAHINLYNRSVSRGLTATDRLGIPYRLLSGFHPAGYDLIIHATPQGKKEHELPFDPALASDHAVIIDLTYSRGLTPLISLAQQCGLRTGSGREILVHQVRQQFLGMTGREMPLEMALEYAGIAKINTIS